MNNLSEESKDLLRDMFNTEAWRIYEAIQQEQILNLRVLATSQTTMLEDPKKALWFSAMAQGREDSFINIKDLLYANIRKETGSDG